VISVKNNNQLTLLKTKTVKTRKQHGINENFVLKFDDESQEAFPESRRKSPFSICNIIVAQTRVFLYVLQRSST